MGLPRAWAFFTVCGLNGRLKRRAAREGRRRAVDVFGGIRKPWRYALKGGKPFGGPARVPGAGALLAADA
jgi:hypothetical protein